MSRRRLVPSGTLLAVLAWAAMQAGCSTPYQPKPGPRLSMVMKGGQIEYHRDGKVFPFGVGGGLVQAVEGDAEAEAYARSAYHENIATLALLGLGLVSMVAAVGVLESSPRNQAGELDPSTGRAATAVGLEFGGLLMIFGGLVPAFNAQTDAASAINVYNDHHAPQ